MSEVIVGIDLGTTQSAVGVMDSGFPILLADESGSVLTPSVVWYGGDGKVEVGQKALRRAGVDRVFASVKSLIGRRYDELDELQKKAVTEQVTFSTASGEKSPEEISAEILKELKEPMK